MKTLPILMSAPMVRALLAGPISMGSNNTYNIYVPPAPAKQEDSPQ